MPLAACGTAAPSVSPSAAVVPSPGPSTAPAATAKADTGAGVLPVVFKPADSVKPAVGAALNAFSLDLFRRLEEKDAGKNVFISPLSVWLALCMTYNGASGGTASGMAEALHAPGIPVGDLNTDNSGLIGVLTAADPNVKTSIADSIWVGKRFEPAIGKSFLDANRSAYDALIRTVDFTDAGTVPAMNGWVEEKTNGKIRDLIQPPLSGDTVMVLINAVYFNAPWKQAFDPRQTYDGEFQAVGGSAVKAQFMFRKKDNVGYADEEIRVARLPYSTGRLEMVALMPEKQPLSGFAAGLTPESLQAYIDKCGETSMSLTFPKFRVEYKASLQGALTGMGMGEAFDADKAEFRNMSQTMGDDLFISKVEHKSFIQVDEAGTEAAAATSVVMEASAMMMELDFTKPFVYLIRDTVTGAILFIGTMENPA